jgi:hypothetical protein
MSTKIKVLCSVPEEYCNGTRLVTDQGFHTCKAHTSHCDAFRCMCAYLVKIGFKRVSSREFVNPENGYTRVLTRQTKFGGLLVTGKEKTRFMPEKRNVGNRGVIL